MRPFRRHFEAVPNQGASERAKEETTTRAPARQTDARLLRVRVSWPPARDSRPATHDSLVSGSFQTSEASHSHASPTTRRRQHAPASSVFLAPRPSTRFGAWAIPSLLWRPLDRLSSVLSAIALSTPAEGRTSGWLEHQTHCFPPRRAHSNSVRSFTSLFLLTLPFARTLDRCSTLTS